MGSRQARGKVLLATTFSPMMLAPGAGVASVREVKLVEAKSYLRHSRWTSAVGHENTAELLTRLLDTPVEFKRVQVSLCKGDLLVVICPQFRTDQAREFTDEEIAYAPVRAFIVRV